jgi:hypothetical protein
MVLMVSNWLQISVANEYIGAKQKQVIESSILEQGINNIEKITREAPKKITQEQVKIGFTYGLLISWIPWFLLGRYMIGNLGLYSFTVVISLIAYDPLWFNPIIFILSFYLGHRIKGIRLNHSHKNGPSN